MLEVMAHNGSINCLAVHDNGGLICLGKDDGTVALMELSDGFVSSPNMRVTIKLFKKVQIGMTKKDRFTD